MFRVYRCLDVHRGQKGEDVGLEDGDDDLEHVDAEPEGKPADADGDLGEASCTGDEHVARYEQQRQHHVTGDQVGEEPDGQRERTNEERRHKLDRGDQEVERFGNAGWEQRLLEVAQTLFLEASDHEDDPGQDREQRRDRPQPGRHGEVDERRYLKQVADEDEHEERQQPGEVLQAVLWPDDADGNLVSNEPDDHLNECPELRGDQSVLVADDAEVEQGDHDDHDEDKQAHRPVPEPKEGELEQFVDALRYADDLVLCVTFRGGEDQLLHSNSLSAPLATASASQDNSTR